MKLFLSTITKGSHLDTLMMELNAWYNLKKPKLELQDLTFLCKILQRKSKSKWWKKPTVQYKNSHNWPMQTLHHLCRT
jgi:hypothetical protein